MEDNSPARHILLVEDNPGDVRLITDALAASGTAVAMDVVSDGLQAMDFLHLRGSHANAHRPAIIVLDLNLPALDGRQVLAQVKADPGLKHIPVVILTSSNAEKDVLKTYDLCANCYVVKPFELDQFIDTVGKTLEFWLKIVILPPF